MSDSVRLKSNMSETPGADGDVQSKLAIYVAPRLVHLGSVRTLTLGKSGPDVDSQPGGTRKPNATPN